jgi:hypothetical protein
MQTGSSGTLIAWKSRTTTFVLLWDRMEEAWLWTQFWPPCSWDQLVSGHDYRLWLLWNQRSVSLLNTLENCWKHLQLCVFWCTADSVWGRRQPFHAAQMIKAVQASPSCQVLKCLIRKPREKFRLGFFPLSCYRLDGRGVGRGGGWGFKFSLKMIHRERYCRSQCFPGSYTNFQCVGGDIVHLLMCTSNLLCTPNILIMSVHT